MQRLIISLAVASVFSAIPSMMLAAPRLIESENALMGAVVQSGETFQEKLRSFDTRTAEAFEWKRK